LNANRNAKSPETHQQFQLCLIFLLIILRIIFLSMDACQNLRAV